MCVVKEAETDFVNGYDPSAVLFNLYRGIIPRVHVKERQRERTKRTGAAVRQKWPPTKSEAQYTGHGSGDTCFLLFSSPCRCVEIIAKEGRSLKELYLVSCKITDHGRILSITVPLLQSPSDITIITIVNYCCYHDSGLIWLYNLPLMRLANSKNIIEKFHTG